MLLQGLHEMAQAATYRGHLAASRFTDQAAALLRGNTMANRHFGNLADVFKHIVLAECVGTLRPGEYWESHAGRAENPEADEIPPERIHGVHMFRQLADTHEVLRQSHYMRALRKSKAPGAATEATPLRQIPGSPLIARHIWGREARRFLLCDTDADSLLNIRRELPTAGGGDGELADDRLECVQEDGITVLRGAGVLLPAEWAASVLALVDPYDLEAPSDAGITALELACELANRAIKALVFYGFADEEGRRRRRDAIRRETTRARLAGPNRNVAQWFEGSLTIPAEAPSCPTQWGFGMLTLNLPLETLAAIDGRLRGLETAYADVELAAGTSGAWRYARGAV
jgi:23S rRNA A2030 N6-methylase RlmJ